MGACECENPMEFGYEVNAEEKDEQSSSKNNYRESNPNTSNNNYLKNISNVINTDTNREKQNLNMNRNQARNYEINENGNMDNEEFEEEEKKEGVEALRARYENEKNPNDESDKNSQTNNNNNQNQQFLFNTSIDEPSDDFSKYIFDGINNIRENPQSFIQKIEKSKKNIMYDKNGICVYKSSVKVALSQIKDKTYMNEIINEKVQCGVPIKSFWRDIIKDRETCLLLMIVDDTGANSGKKRNDILDPTMQCIGITSKRIGKSFASYVTIC